MPLIELDWDLVSEQGYRNYHTVGVDSVPSVVTRNIREDYLFMRPDAEKLHRLTQPSGRTSTMMLKIKQGGLSIQLYRECAEGEGMLYAKSKYDMHSKSRSLVTDAPTVHLCKDKVIHIADNLDSKNYVMDDLDLHAINVSHPQTVVYVRRGRKNLANDNRCFTYGPGGLVPARHIDLYQRWINQDEVEAALEPFNYIVEWS